MGWILGWYSGNLRASLGGKVSIGSAANPGDSPDAVAVVAAGFSRSIHPSNPGTSSGMNGGQGPPDIGCFQGQIRDHRLSDGERHSSCRRLSPPLTDHPLFPPAGNLRYIMYLGAPRYVAVRAVPRLRG
jgi:hypothetical protein